MIVVLGIFCLTGCTFSAGPDLSSPINTIRPFSPSGCHEIPDKWWTAFGDRELNRFVNQALRSNFDLKTAWQRLREARAVVDRETASLFPDLQGVAEGEKVRRDSDITERLELGLASEYELDLWGRIESGIEAEQYRADAALSDYETAVLSVSAEVVRTWYQLMEVHSQMELLDEQIETNRKMLDLIKARFGTGQSRRVDVLRQEQLLESTREQRVLAESKVRVLEHRLAVLSGRPPQNPFKYEAKGLPPVPPFPDTGLPVELVQRRPDVKSAYNRLKAADRDTAVSISNRYPRVTMQVSASTLDEGAEKLFEIWAGSFSAGLVAPLLDAGRRKAEVERTRAVEQQRLYEYGRTILESFQEVENALIREKKQISRIESLKKQLRLADESHEQVKREYFNGMNDFIDVLTALSEKQRIQRNLLEAGLMRLEYRIALYRALAGGFDIKEKAGKE